MPKLLTQKTTRARKLPPCGRVNDYQTPHSPWQKLVDGKRLALDMSYGDLAEHVDVHRSTLWIWTHNKNGFPHPKSCKPHHLQALAKALRIDLAEMQSALDASRHLFTPRETPMPQDSQDAFATLVAALKADKRTYVKVAYVINLAQLIQAGAAAPAIRPEDGAAPTAIAKPAKKKARSRRS